MSFLYRITVSAPSMTTSGIRRPHIMPLQNIREPPPCSTRWAVCLRHSARPDCLQTRLRWLSGWRHMRHSSVNRTWCQFWRVNSACFWAHLYPCSMVSRCQMWTSPWMTGVKFAHHAAYFVNFESKHNVLWLHEKHYSAWWCWFQASSELKSVSSSHQLQ